MSHDDWVMFIPANGDGTRVAERGPKHSLRLPDGTTAMSKVASMASSYMPLEIAIRQSDVQDLTIPLIYPTLHFMGETSGQANTVYEWLRRTRKRKYVLISNCDNWIDPNSIKLGMRLIEDGRTTCVVPTFRPLKANDKRFSYVKGNKSRFPKEIIEHDAVSDQAVAGVYMVSTEHLQAELRPDDIYLSQTLSHFPSMYTFQVEHYMGWGDMEQLAELEQNITQYRVD